MLPYGEGEVDGGGRVGWMGPETMEVERGRRRLSYEEREWEGAGEKVIFW